MDRERNRSRNGDSFGEILDRNHVGYPKIFNIAEKAKDTFDIRRLQIGKPYTLLCAKDSLETAQCFIYQPNLEEYVVINFQDSIQAYKSRKPIAFVEKTATGTDSTKGIVDYFSEDAKNLRRAFLKAPVKFSRISSRYNLKRRIAVYGYKVRPHRGTDFAAPIGTPIMATANGTVTKSEKRGGNGNYVKIRHNATYETQYLHMKKRKSKVGEFVKQGDVIGWVGMTGNTGGPHVCYRFWKNGKEVDPFKQKLPEAKQISDSLKVEYLKFIEPVKSQLDNIHFLEDVFEDQNQPEHTLKQNDKLISLKN